MPFDVFRLRDTVVGDYRSYFESFVNILDPAIDTFVRERLDVGDLWPDAVLQLNPAFAPAATLRELAGAGEIEGETARFFGPDLRLHRHQQDALAAARGGEPYLVSTGTGSGKSLTYLVPIVDAVLRDQPERHSVRAIIVYPMNALINSQIESLERFRDANWPGAPVRFAQYTGQTKREERQQIVDDPPHILLTNYVMLEYLLIRPYERALVGQATRDLRFLVLDELHVYRGRQGADVAMLLRRVRQRAGTRLLLIGTSATIATAGKREDRLKAIADVGTTLFGVPVPADNVVDETLQRIASVPVPVGREAVAAAVGAPPPAAEAGAVAAHPLAAWAEATFGIAEEDGRLVRRRPITFAEGLGRLVEESGLSEERCAARLKALLEAGHTARTPAGEPVFAFRLHQFLSSGGSVYATLEPPERRELTMQGQYTAPGRGAGDRERRLFPLAFCRECGQEHYLVALGEGEGRPRLAPRSPLLNTPPDDELGRHGFFVVERDGLWSGDVNELPESWLEQRRGGPQLRKNYRDHEPRRYWARPDGSLSEEPVEDGVEGWFQPRPLMLCLRCRAAYDLREKQDFRKLATLSQTGRSTATTTVTTASVAAMREDGVEPGSAKVLSFTDNRQDASLQAGHLNDFVQVALLRGALVRALAEGGDLGFERIGQAAFDALALEPEHFMREPVAVGPGYRRARELMVDLLEYRAFEDLRRAWRVAQPNLEQSGLLRIDYDGLDELAAEESLWAGAGVLARADAVRREAVLRAVLNHLRAQLAIDAESLSEGHTQELVRRANQTLREPWTVDARERLQTGRVALLPGVSPAEGEDPRDTVGLGWRSAIGRYLRSRHTWDIAQDLTGEEVDGLVRAVVAGLRGQLLTVARRGGADYGVQLLAGALRWRAGDGVAPGPDPVRARALYLRKGEHLATTPNRYFAALYRDRAVNLKGIVGREHTGQVAVADRREREREFREGQLPALFCSPTMELGVDISDLSVVHLRNVPPTPANYAQRSGRAGRGGRPALVLAFCSQGNAHDQYFFKRQNQMITGAVAPARMDLSNPELVAAHLHSMWLAEVGLKLGSSMEELIDREAAGYPLHAEKQAQLALPRERRLRVAEGFREVTAGLPDGGASRLSADGLDAVIAQAPERFDRAMDRWRELYQAAVRQRDDARRVVDAPRVPRAQRQEAEQREREALRELDMLLNRADVDESDFYPYRYLASEGFLPGYNFPRLPLRALVSRGDETQAIERPRFLGLTEFGPHNVIYHEGRKHRVTACVVPPGGIASRISRAKICDVCDYVHPGDEALADVCAHCGTELDAATSSFPQRLFEQSAVRTWRWSRITADEEERAREGYDVTTHYRFAPGGDERRVEIRDAEGAVLIEATYAPQAELWTINQGWRRTRTRRGFTLDATNGRWAKSENDDVSDEQDDATTSEPLSGVKPYVTDHRNILLLRPRVPGSLSREFLVSLTYALQRGIQVIYQVEEREVDVELVGREDHTRILLWEAAEGGTGVWERLMAEPRGFAEVAREALRLCHFDPVTGEEDPDQAKGCATACYDCLLSYTNQPEHRYINRHAVKDALLRVAGGETVPITAGRDYEEQYRWLLERIDPGSSLEREFLDALYARRLRLPDRAQYRPEDEVAAQPDFSYERDGLRGVCVFVDGPAHDQPEQARRDRAQREALEDLGYRVVSIRHDRPMAEQLAAHGEVFGRE